MRYLLLILMFFVSDYSNGQGIINEYKKDSILLERARKYLYKKLDSEFVEKNLKFVKLYRREKVAVYEITNTKNYQGRNTILIYFKDMTVDKNLSILSRDEILKSINGDSTCTLYIGMEKAMEMAKSSGLKGYTTKPWKMNVTILAPSGQIPKWYISSTNASVNGDYSIQRVEIMNMTDGTYTTAIGQSEP